MGRKSSYSDKLKLEIVKRYLNGDSATKLANQYNMNGSYGDSRYDILMIKKAFWIMKLSTKAK